MLTRFFSYLMNLSQKVSNIFGRISLEKSREQKYSYGIKDEEERQNISRINIGLNIVV